jgi:para-nitrobenzyl esterase
VTSGVPRNPHLPDWPTYDPVRRATMLLDDTSRVVDDPLGEERRLWDGVRY